MILRPQNRDELLQQLRDNFSRGAKITSVDLSALNSIVEHSPEDMTASAGAGLTVAAFQDHLRASRQWLPIDPPHPQALSIGDLLAHDLSGCRRLGYGTIRDYLIGIKVALADGTLIKAGGKVVKNVAGYDLCKLFVGARHSLGVIVEATFKLRPLAEAEDFVSTNISSLSELDKLRTALLNSRTDPILFDAFSHFGQITCIAGFAGSREDVEAQTQIALAIGFQASSESKSPISLLSSFASSRPISVLPSRTIATLEQLRPTDFLVHLGNGIIYYRGGIPSQPTQIPTALMNRVKNAYDPKKIFPEYTA
ncbi:MAG TPA: FAD-binding oxidoreductase [Verrucomicrobiae bacterium]